VRCGASLVGDAEDEGAETGAGQASRALLVVVLALTGILAAGIVALFLLPPPHLKVPDIQPVVRVANVRDFPTGTSRMVTWGDRSILVVRRDTHAYFAIDGVGSGDGCFLEWNAEALRVESPCTYVVYDLDGNVVTGLTRTPLKRYRVFERHDVVYVTES
jgi:nitrite reductase/ring-hydroxylating ferredoxin subunit